MKALAATGLVAVIAASVAAIAITVAALATPAFLDAVSKLGPAATGVVAVVALIVGISTIRQKREADADLAEAERRDQWWKRAQWAIDRLHEEPEDRQVVAWRILQTLAESNLAGDEELAIFDAVAGEGLILVNEPESGPLDRGEVRNNGGEQEGAPK